MSKAEQSRGQVQEKRKIPDRMPKKESLSAGYALPAFAHSLNGLTLISRSTYPQPVNLPTRFQRKVDKAASTHTSGVVRIEHIEVAGDTVSYDAFPSDWRSWHLLSQKRWPNKERERLASLTGVSVAWLTTEPDGSRKLVVQKRDKRNATNPSTYGPSASGAWDAQTTLVDGKRMLNDASPEDALRNVYRETEEELGLPLSILRSPGTHIVTSGVVKDTLKPHYDVTYFGTLPISADEIRRINVIAREKDKGKEYGHGGTDGLTFIDANPESLRTMLTEVKSYLPPVSVATFLLAGYMLTMQNTLAKTGNQEQAAAEALAWKNETEQGIERNYRKIFRRSRAVNKINSREAMYDAMSNGIFRKGLIQDIRNARELRKTYNTRLSPQEQGLEDVDFALQDRGIERTNSAPYLLNGLLDQGTLYPHKTEAAKQEHIMTFIDPAVAYLQELANTQTDTFGFLKNFESSKDPAIELLYGPKESRLAKLQYKIDRDYEYLPVPNTNIVLPVRAETWSSDIKFEGKRERTLNEDALFTIPFGNGRVVSGVFDGIRSREGDAFDQFGVSGAWYVSHLTTLEFPYSEEFAALSQNPSATGKDVMTALNSWLRSKLETVEGIDFSDVLKLPGLASTIAIVDYNKQLVNIAHVADTMAVAEYDNGYEVLTDNKNAKWDEETEELVDTIVRESKQKGTPLSPLEASMDPRVRQQLRDSFRAKINTKEGTGIVNGQDTLISNDLIYTKTVPIPKEGGMRIHLVTDGMYSVWTNRKNVQDSELGVRKLLGALDTPQYAPGNLIYYAITQLELDPDTNILSRSMKAFDDATRVSLLIRPIDEQTQFQKENKKLLWADYVEILDILRKS